MTEKKTILITGANRGLGLGLVSRMLAAGHTVIATARHPDGARELWEMERDYRGRCRTVTLDVSTAEDLDRLTNDLKGQVIDILINNAGIFPDGKRTLQELGPEDLLKGFTVNAMAPLFVTRALLPALQASRQPTVVFMSSLLGSMSDNKSGGAYAYRMSKAALNMLAKNLANDFPTITSVAMHPGWVQTDMGGVKAPLTVAESTGGMAKVILGLSKADSGKFLDYRGEELPW